MKALCNKNLHWENDLIGGDLVPAFTEGKEYEIVQFFNHHGFTMINNRGEIHSTLRGNGNGERWEQYFTLISD